VHPLAHVATKVGVFDVNPMREEKNFLNAQLKIDPWQPFCVWRSQPQFNAASQSYESAGLYISVGHADGTVVTSKIGLGETITTAPLNLTHSVILSSNHRVTSLVSAPSHPFLAAVCDGCLFIMSTDPFRFNSSGPTVITRVKKCRQAIAFDDQILYFLTDGKDRINCLPLARLLDQTAKFAPQLDGKTGRLYDVASITMPISCTHNDVTSQLHQLDVTALSASCCILAIAHTKGFLVVDLKRNTSNIIHSAIHDGSSRVMITIMPGGIVAVANHPFHNSVDEIKKTKKDEEKFFEESIVFLQPPRSRSAIQSLDELLRKHQIYCVRYSGTGCTIKGMASVGSFMFVLLGSRDATVNFTDHTPRGRDSQSGNAFQSCFLDICIPSSGLSLNHYRSHSATNCVNRLQELTFNMPCFDDYKLKWIVSAGSMIACINDSACADITFLELNPLLFQNIMDAHWFQEAKNQALPPLNVSNGSCEWDRLDTLVPMLEDHWWKTLCFNIPRPQKFVQQRLLHMNQSFQMPQSITSVSCFRSISRNIWELVIREDDADEVRKQREFQVESMQEIGLDSSFTMSAPSPQHFNPWRELVCDCSFIASKSVDENRSEFEKLDIAFGRSSPSLKRGVIKQANNEEIMQKSRDIMIAGMNKKDKMSLAMSDLASGPCARLFEMHLCLRNISLSRTIGVDMLPLTMSCCLYAPNGSRLTPNHEVDRKPNDLSPFKGDCVFANLMGNDAKNQQPPRFVIAAFRFYCHYRGDKSSPGKKYLEKEVVADIKAEQMSIFKELSNLGHLLQPLAWSFVVIPLDAHDLKEFIWPEWVNPEEKACFMSQATPKGMQHSDSHWLFESERGFCSPIYRLNNRALTDDDIKGLVQNIPPRRERLTQSTFLSFTARKGYLALPSMSSSTPPIAVIKSLPEDHNVLASHPSVFLEGILTNVRETPISCYRPCFDGRHELFLLPQSLVSSGLKKAHNLLLEVMVRTTDSKIEQDETMLLTDLDDHKKEQMGFLKCIKGIRRLRDPPQFFDAVAAEKVEKSTAAESAASLAGEDASNMAGQSSCMMFSDLSPLIYHEVDCNLSSQIHILLPFIPPSKAVKMHVLFNIYHVSCWNTKKKQASKGQLQLIGRGYHPLLQFAPTNLAQHVSDLHEGLRIPLAMKLDPGYLDHHQKGPEGFFHREVNACVQLNCIWHSNIWPASAEVSSFAWQCARIMSIIHSAEQVHGESHSQSAANNTSEHLLSSRDAVDDHHEAPSVRSDSVNLGSSVGSSSVADKFELPVFLESKPSVQKVSWFKTVSGSERLPQRLHDAVFLACELPSLEPSVLLKFLPVWSQAIFDLLPLVDQHQSMALFEAFVACIFSMKHASDLNHDFIQSILSDWVTWSVSISHHHPVGAEPLYIVLLREFVRLLRPWLGLSSAFSYTSFAHSHTAALSVADVILSLISKLAASTGHTEPIGIETAWGHISRLSSSLGSLIASCDMHAIFQSPIGDPSKEVKDQPLKELSNYLNVCSALAEFLRGWFSLGQRGATAHACFAFCHELYRHETCETLIVYFWKRFCSDIRDTPFLFPPAYPDVPFPLFHWTGPVTRRIQRASVVGKHIGKAGVENTPIVSVAFNLCSGMLLRGSPNGSNLGLCIVNSIIASSCEFTHSCTASTIRSAASPLLERLLVASVPFISKNHSSNSQAVTVFFSLVARTLTCVSEVDWEQYWLQEIDKGNLSSASSFPSHSQPSSSAHEQRAPQEQPAPMSLFGWLKAMLIVAFKENPGLDSETGSKSTSVDPISSIVTSKFLNYSGKLDDDVKFSLALSISNGLHVLLTRMKSEVFLQRIDISERKTHFFDLLLCDDSARITGLTTDQNASKVCTLFEGTWSLLLHLHFVLVCSQNSFEYKSKIFELPMSSSSTSGPPIKDADAVQRRGSVTKQSQEAAANAKDILGRQYTKQQGNTLLKLDDKVVKNVYVAIHDSMKLLLEQSVHCLFSSSSHTVLSSRYRNRVILQIFLEGTNMNQSYPSEFCTTQAFVSPSRPMSAPSDLSSSSKSGVASLPTRISYDFCVSDETQSSSSNYAAESSRAPAMLDTTSSSSSSTLLNKSDESAPNEMLFSRGAQTRSSKFDSLAPLRALSMRSSSLCSLDTLRDQGNIRFLTDFLLMFIREDFNLNSSNLFATRCDFPFFSDDAQMFFSLTFHGTLQCH
jgi:hypothetical protein